MRSIASQSGSPQERPRWPRPSMLDAAAAELRRAAHAQRLFEAAHAAELRDGLVGLERERLGQRLELEVEARVLAGERQPPGPQRLDRLDVEAGRADRVPRAGVLDGDRALGGDRRDLGAVEQHARGRSRSRRRRARAAPCRRPRLPRSPNETVSASEKPSLRAACGASRSALTLTAARAVAGGWSPTSVAVAFDVVGGRGPRGRRARAARRPLAAARGERRPPARTPPRRP